MVITPPEDIDEAVCYLCRCVSRQQYLLPKVLHGNLIFVVATHHTTSPLSSQHTLSSKYMAVRLQEVCTDELHRDTSTTHLEVYGRAGV